MFVDWQRHTFRRLILPALVLAALVSWTASAALAQPGGGGTTVIGVSQNAVGGVSINADGVLDKVSLDAQRRLARMRREARQALDSDIQAISPLRKVSLRRLEQQIVQAVEQGKPVDQSMQLLAGLQRIRYVFVYPEHQDIVLVGPAEGWQTDAQGNIVGRHSGRAVLKLDDLLVALRSTVTAPGTSFECSIDPTQQGMQRLQKLLRSGQLKQMSPQAVDAIQQALGPQMIRVGGVPETSHFAQVMVAADYRMKRLAMNLDRSPIPSMPSYLHLASTRGSMTPRWWLAPNYDSIAKDPSGTAWEFSGQGIRAMAEDDFFATDGTRRHSTRANPAAQRWADQMTQHYDALARAVPVFGELQGCVDLALVASLIVKEQLAQKARCPLSHLLDAEKLTVSQWPAPRRVDTQASVMKKGRHWIISASGGVQMNTWGLVDQAREKPALAKIREQLGPTDPNRWWWD